MLVVTRIPTHRNDGSKISRRERRGILNLVRDTFGGYTLEGPFEGAWGRMTAARMKRPAIVWKFLCLPIVSARHESCLHASEGSSTNEPSTSRCARPAK